MKQETVQTKLLKRRRHWR